MSQIFRTESLSEFKLRNSDCILNQVAYKIRYPSKLQRTRGMTDFSMMNAQAILDFIEGIGVLKNLPRTGWRFRGIKDAESVADHCYRVSLLSMLLADLLTEQGVPLNVERVIRIQDARCKMQDSRCRIQDARCNES